MPVFTDEYFMREALKEARQAATEQEVPIGAVVVSGNQIVGRGHNLVERLQDVTAHAEIIALTAASTHFRYKYMHQCTLYVTLEPCPMCAAALAWAQLGRLVIGANDEKRGYTVFQPKLLHKQTDVTSGVLTADCETLLHDFFKGLRT